MTSLSKHLSIIPRSGAERSTGLSPLGIKGQTTWVIYGPGDYPPRVPDQDFGHVAPRESTPDYAESMLQWGLENSARATWMPTQQRSDQ